MKLQKKIIQNLNNSKATMNTKKNLAALRNSIGKPLAGSSDIWPMLFESMPEDFLSTTGDETREERAIVTSLQIYALMDQAKDETTYHQSPNRWDNFGTSLSQLRRVEDPSSTDRRFTAMVSAITYQEFTHHLRQLAKILKSNTHTMIDYPKLARDLYLFQNPKLNKQVKLNWARQYYRQNNTNQGEDNNAK